MQIDIVQFDRDVCSGTYARCLEEWGGPLPDLVAQGKPILAICLGAQLLAGALGERPQVSVENGVSGRFT